MFCRMDLWGFYVKNYLTLGNDHIMPATLKDLNKNWEANVLSGIQTEISQLFGLLNFFSLGFCRIIHLSKEQQKAFTWDLVCWCLNRQDPDKSQEQERQEIQTNCF